MREIEPGDIVRFVDGKKPFSAFAFKDYKVIEKHSRTVLVNDKFDSNTTVSVVELDTPYVTYKDIPIENVELVNKESENDFCEKVEENDEKSVEKCNDEDSEEFDDDSYDSEIEKIIQFIRAYREKNKKRNEKYELKNGDIVKAIHRFGDVMYGVVVNDVIIFDNGYFDFVDNFDETLENICGKLSDAYIEIEEVFHNEGKMDRGFASAKNGFANSVWRRK